MKADNYISFFFPRLTIRNHDVVNYEEREEREEKVFIYFFLIVSVFPIIWPIRNIYI